MKAPKGKPGRKSTLKVSEAEILKRIAEGESLRSICRDAGMAESTVRMIFRADEGLAAQYAHARDAQADHYAERVVDEALTSTDASIGRLRMDALKWAASKLAPKRYGEKVAHVGGGEGDAPIKTQGEITVRFVKAGDPTEPA